MVAGSIASLKVADTTAERLTPVAPATGEAMAQLVTDPRAESMYEPFAPGRFRW